jgi:plasmid stabilization system protein ParE
LIKKFVLHPEAYTDIDDAWEYIAFDNLDAADRVREEIYGAIDKLVAFPHQGHKRPDLTRRPLRFLTVREYLIAYAPDEKPLLVIAVLHGRRNPRTLAAILNARQ